MMKRLISTCLFILLCLSINTQAQQITGRVIDNKGNSLEMINVILYNSADSAFITGTITNESGMFTFKDHPKEKLYIKLTCIGYTEMIYPIKDRINDTYTMYEANTKLDDIIITTEKPKVKINDGKLTFDVPALIKQRPINNAFDVLGEIPGVEKFGNKANIIGANSTTIIINGRVSSMSQEQVIEQLKSLPPERIKSIEVLYATPPEYGVQGSSINIVMDRPRKEKKERKAEFMLSGKQAHYFSPSTGIFYSSTNKNSLLNISYSFRNDRNHPKEDLNAIHTIESNTYSISSLNRTKAIYNIHNLGINFDYDLKDKSTISFSYNFKYTDLNSSRNGILTIDNNKKISSVNKTSGPSNLQSISTKYNHKNTSIGIDYSYYNNKNDQHLSNTEESIIQSSTSNSEQIVNRGSIYITNQQIFEKKQKLSYGINAMIGKSKNSQLSVTEKKIENDFSMNQSEYSANGFIGWSQSVGSKLNFNANLALEYFNSRIRLEKTYHTLWNNWHIYPTISMVYKIAPMNMLQLSISNEKKYPTYWQVTPNITYMNAYTMIEGNPLIKPSQTYSGRLNYIFKGKYIFQLFGNTTSDYIQQLLYQSNTKLQAIYKVINFKRHNTFGIMTVLPFKISNILESRAVLSSFLIQDKGNIEEIYFDREHLYGRFMLSNNIYLNSKRNLSLELNAFYATKALQGIYDIKPMYNLSAGLVWNASERLKINIIGDDLLNGRRARPSSHLQNQNSYQTLYDDTRMLSITVRYNVGGYKEKKHDEVDTSRLGIQ